MNLNPPNSLHERGLTNPRVLAAMMKIKRERFVPPEYVSRAYEDHPLPIGHGQTISQPYMVGIMTELLEPEPTDRILEIGTGSGYQAAILAEMVQSVYTVELLPSLAEEATARLRELGYRNVIAKTADGYLGWPEHSPFDGILVTAASRSIPEPLVEQLRPGARLVIPVGEPEKVQELVTVEKGPDGRVIEKFIMPVRFVPFKRAK